MRADAFTLSELLIALAVLGLIATFSIPKLIHGVHLQHRNAVIKDVYSDLSELTYRGFQEGAVTDTASFINYINSHINAVKFCPAGAIADGCRSVSWAESGWDNRPAFLLSNGATLGLDTYVDGSLLNSTYLLDWNGDDGPNLHLGSLDNRDTLSLRANFSTEPITSTALCPTITATNSIKQGAVRGWCTASQDFLEEVLQN